MKKRCAKEALNYIKEGMTVGLGGGSTVAYLAQYLKESGIQVQIVTPSVDTMDVCKKLGLSVIPVTMADQIDIAFDGCDELDLQLHALKTCGAIHTKEKIIASLAKDYVILADQSKLYDEIPLNLPVSLEVIPESVNYVINETQKIGGKAIVRKSDAKAGYVISDHGNYIVDVAFSEKQDAAKLHTALKLMTGVVETALFVNEVTFALVIDGEEVRVIR
jgi:ribose 5-phosphate isomerase A